MAQTFIDSEGTVGVINSTSEFILEIQKEIEEADINQLLENIKFTEDYIWSIAQRHNVSMSEVMSLSPDSVKILKVAAKKISDVLDEKYGDSSMYKRRHGVRLV